MSAQFIGVTGLPRAGSTLLCQLLSMHPEIDCEGLSSPLCNALLAMRRIVSDDQFMLSQLDGNFETSYGKFQSAMTGFLRGWTQGSGKRMVVDKNRAWLHCIELLLHLAPEARLLVCVRELGQIYGSIEAQHQNTILLDFIDHLADYDRFGRADVLFAKDKAIGAPLISLHAVPDLPRAVRERLYFVRFEDMMAQPAACMASIFGWLGLPPVTLDFSHLPVLAAESDSHYHMKYRHRQGTSFKQAGRHEIPPRIQTQIENSCRWFYDAYYPNLKT